MRCKQPNQTKQTIVLTTLHAKLNAAALASLLAILHPGAQAQAQAPKTNALAADAEEAALVRVQSEAGGVRVFHLRQNAALADLTGCPEAKQIKLKGTDKRSQGEYSLVHAAIKTARKLVLVDAKCLGNGMVEATSLSLQPDPPAPLDCTLPAPNGRAECASK